MKHLQQHLENGSDFLEGGSRTGTTPNLSSGRATTRLEESIYTDDPVRVYLREMGAVPLLTREGEVNLARRMERGKTQMRRAISRSPLAMEQVLALMSGSARAKSRSILG